MSAFAKPAGAHKFGDQDNLSGVWVSQVEVSHVGLTFVDVGDVIPYTEASTPKPSDKPKDPDGDPNAPSNVWVMHLSGAKIMQDLIDWSSSKKHYLVAPTQLDPELAKTFPTYLANVVLNAKSSKIPFGINWLGSKGTINGDGLFVPRDGEEGFTCATFVCEAFRGFGLHVANPEGWDDDKIESEKWRVKLVDELTAGKNTPQETIDKIVKASPVVRLRPAEMAAGASMLPTGWPISSKAVEDLVVDILADFAAAYPPPVKKPASVNAGATPTNQMPQPGGATTGDAGA